MKGLRGNFVGSDFPRDSQNFLLIVSRQRTKHRHAHRVSHGRHIVQRLRGHLSQAVSGDDAQRAIGQRQAFRDAQHHAAIQQHAIRFRRLRHDLALDGFERHQLQLGRKLIRHQAPHQFARRVHRAFPRPRPAAPEMHEAQVRPALHHFVRRHRRIESARKQAGHAPRGVRRQTARPRNFPRVNQRRPRRDFDAASDLRIAQLHAHFPPRFAQPLQQISPHQSFDFRHRVRKRFVAALGPHRERRKSFRGDFLPRRAANIFERLLAAAIHRPRHRVISHAKNALQPRPRLLQRSPFAQFDHQPIRRQPHALQLQPLESSAHRRHQL